MKVQAEIHAPREAPRTAASGQKAGARQRRYRAAAALLVAVSLCHPTAAAAAPTAGELAELEPIFEEWRLAAHVPGLVYGLIIDGKLAAVRGLGAQDLESRRPVGAMTRFRIASMSKAFTALAILKLRDEGRLSLDDPAERHVPELGGWRYPTSDSPRITLRHLLHHTAGFVEDNPWGDRQQPMPEAEFSRLLAGGVAFASVPGVRMEYSNLGYAILGRVITNVAEKRYQDYIEASLLAPLNMRATGFDVFAAPPAERALGYRWDDGRWLREPDMPDGAFGAMGGLQTTAADYARWLTFLLSAWPARDGPDAGPVSRTTVREIATGSNYLAARSRTEPAGAAPCRQPAAYAMGWTEVLDCELGRMLVHSGGYPGYGSIAMMLPHSRTGIFVFANRTYAEAATPALRALLTLNRRGAIKDPALEVSPGLAAAYAAARAVWQSGDIARAPLAGNMLLDRSADTWRARLAKLKHATGPCADDAPIRPVSAMEGSFTWNCRQGRVTGRVQRSPEPALRLQALEFAAAQP